MQGYLDVRQILMGQIVEVCVEATQDRLMSNDQDVFLSLKFHDDGFEANDDVPVRFATAVSVVEFILVAVRKVFRVGLLYPGRRGLRR